MGQTTTSAGDGSGGADRGQRGGLSLVGIRWAGRGRVRRVPGAPGCPMFPADNVWNTDISGLPVDSHSAAWLASMNSATTNLHPDFGPSG